MKVKITGSTGYLRKVLSDQLEQNNHIVKGIARELLYGPATDLANDIAGYDAIINLAGAPILQQWTKKNKEVICNSRIKTTSNLVLALGLLPTEKRPNRFISASAVGIYKAGSIHDETSNQFDCGFLGKVVKDWEAETLKLPENIEKVIFRIGIVLGGESKIIKMMLPLFSLGLGGKIGKGTQPFPFIHEKDLASAFQQATEGILPSGTYNLVAPQQITNKEFTKAFAKKINRPSLFALPGFIAKLVLGEASTLLLNNPAILPVALQKNGFVFQFPDIENTLNNLLAKKNLP